MEVSKHKADNLLILPSDTSISHLEIINGYIFTHREIDVIACILSGKSAKKIASFLSIAPKTVRNHIRNIMLKLGCKSQESIIEFVESSGKFLLVKNHYANLLIQSIFEFELKKLAALACAKTTAYLLTDDTGENNMPSVFLQLKKHLRLAGIELYTTIQEKDKLTNKIISEIESQKINFIIYFLPFNSLKKIQETESESSLILNLIQTTNNILEKVIFVLIDKNPSIEIPKELLSLNYVDFAEQKNYYYMILEILKILFLPTSIEKSISEFKRQHEILHEPLPPSQLWIKENLFLKNKNNHKIKIKSSKWKEKILFGSTLFLAFCYIFFFIFTQGMKKNKFESVQSSIIEKTSGATEESQLSSQTKIDMPTSWNLPRQDHLFIGRIDFLNELHQKLNPNSSSKLIMSKNFNALPIVACTGLGGIGKTQLALQYAQHTKHPYTLKAWFPSENIEILRQKYIEFARHLGYSDEKISIESAIFYVKNWLANHSGALLIFDNVASYEDIVDFLPTSGANVLITTRNQFWPKKIQLLPISIMPEEEAINLVNKITNQNDPDTKILVEKLGYLPLALAQSSAYIAYNKINILEYLDLYHRFQQEMLIDPTLPKGAEHDAVALTWNVSLETIEKKSINPDVRHLARIFLTASSYLSPENIPVNLLNQWLEIAYPKLENTELLTYQLLVELQHYSLLQLNKQGKTFTLHRLVQSVMRNQHYALKVDTLYYPQLTHKWYELLLNAINTEFSLRTQPLQDEVRQIGLLSHLQSLADYYEKLPLTTKSAPALGRTLFNIGNVFLRSGAAMLAKPYYERALNIQEKNFGKNHPEVASTLANLGDACRALGGGKQAKVFLEGALDILEQHYGKSHPQLTSALTNLGCAYGTLGEDKQAKNILTRALEIAENHLGQNNPEVADILTKLGDVFGSLGEDIQSKEYAERALKIKEHHYGKDHFTLAVTLTILGSAYGYLNDHETAISHLERAINIQKNHFKKQHRDIAITQVYLGRSYLYKGDPKKAKELLEKSFSYFEQNINTDDYYRIINLTLLGETYDSLKNPKKGKEILEKSLKIAESFFKGPHPEIAITQLKLAKLHIKLNELNIAYPFAKKSYEVLLAAFGKDHILTLEAWEALQECSSRST